MIANLQGTGGSSGQWGFFDEQERLDLYDLVEWAAEQPWSDGNIGMIGISYFAIAQIGAAAARPPHLRAVFPFEVSSDLYEAAYHYGLFSSSFISPWLTMIGVTAPKGDSFWRGHVANSARRVLHNPRVHRRVGKINGESAKSVLQMIMKAPYAAQPWDDLWRATAVDHQTRDEFWDQRTALTRLGQVDIPVYLGCDWDNVPMHLPGTFSTWKALAHNPERPDGHAPGRRHHLALGKHAHRGAGLVRSISEGPRHRHHRRPAHPLLAARRRGMAHLGRVAAHRRVPGTGPGRRRFPHRQPRDGSREYLCLGTGLARPPRAHKSDPPSVLYWHTSPLEADLDVAGDIELQLSATSTAMDTAWIVMLRDIAPDGTITNITGGRLRASLREIDPDASRTGAPVLPCRNPQAVPIGVPVDYRIPLVPNARRFAAGHLLQLMITSDDQPKNIPSSSVTGTPQSAPPPATPSTPPRG